jgi:hypothetical protein
VIVGGTPNLSPRRTEERERVKVIQRVGVMFEDLHANLWREVEESIKSRVVISTF